MARCRITESTRRESLKQVVTDLGERQRMVLDFLKLKQEPMTAREIALEMYENGLIKSPERNMVHPRLTELVLKELIVVNGKKKDKIMNRMVATYIIID